MFLSWRKTAIGLKLRPSLVVYFQIMPNTLTPNDRNAARELWRGLMTRSPEARERLQEAPLPVRDAIFAASARLLENNDEPDDIIENPFA